MKISGFTYVRNGFDYGYPFIPAIQSVLPIVDEMIVVVGDSTDGTREAVVGLNSQKIKIIDTVWDMNMRKGGKIYAQQSNIGIDHTTGDWVIHIQADEVIHEADIGKIKEQIVKFDENEKVDGFILPFYHFWGDFEHIRKTRGTHRYEIRAFRNQGVVRSYRDSQGFRKYHSLESYASGEQGKKLKVLAIDAPVYHYSYTRNPKVMTEKSAIFFHFYTSNDKLIEERVKAKPEFDYNNVDKLVEFKGEHPVYMNEFIDKKDWEFNYDPTKSNIRFKHKLLNKLADLTGLHPFEYRNYKRIKLS